VKVAIQLANAVIEQIFLVKTQKTLYFGVLVSTYARWYTCTVTTNVFLPTFPTIPISYPIHEIKALADNQVKLQP
jgi:hypothetical protein